MRVLQIGADRSKRGILFRNFPAFARQQAYAKEFGRLDIIGFSLRADNAEPIEDGCLTVYPTNSRWRIAWPFDAYRIARSLQKPYVVSVQDPFETGIIGWLVARRFRVPLHVQVHTDFLSPAYARHSLLNRARVLLGGFVLRRAAGIRAVSERIKRSIMEKYHLRAHISVLPIYVDTARFAHAVPDPTLAARFAAFSKKLLVVSRLEREKHVGLALEAFASAAPSGSCLIVVGAGSEGAALRSLAASLGVAGRVFFEGTQNPASYYALADLVLVPSEYEGYGLVVVEALAAGRPVLSTDVGIAREAGAIVAEPERFTESLRQWFRSGPREGVLAAYPYRDFSEYVRAYCADIVARARV